jgi:tetratricopeptide (TPR) repeat protein
MKRIVERHGGVVSKFIGDAVMAVFGLPQIHEDDPLRAVRAAAEMREALAGLNDEFVSVWGVAFAVRIGVNTGEVLARRPDAGDDLVVGDAVNIAARFEQVAEPGEILIGEDTYWHVHEAVSAERVGPLELRGLSEPVRAWRLRDVTAYAPGFSRRLDSPLVDREHELAALEGAFARVAGAGTCEIATVLGPAGVGKSRLTGELLARLDAHATVLQGRCLPYGEGITFLPVVSVLMDAVGTHERVAEREARQRMSALFAGDGDAESELVCDTLAPLLGGGAETAGIRETYWAVRKLLEHLGARRPLVVVFDDIHWGEASFLDLLEYLTDWIRTAPVLLLCQTRPELLDARPGWMSAQQNASLVALGPLSAPHTQSLIEGLVGGTELPADARARIAALAEGNPLFVEETLRMLVDDGVLQQHESRWIVADDLSSISIPPTIHALLGARLDRLEPEERGVIERAAAIGRSFWWGAVSELSPPDVRPRIGACLQSLVRKQLIEPYQSEIPQEDAFRFTHILIRDAAYRRIPKSIRAEMHERLAEWLEAKTQRLAGEYEEIVGYHLEQAHAALVDLGPARERAGALGERAAQRLAATGERAYARGDMPAAVNLLSRAAALLPAHDHRRLELLAEVAFALVETGDFDRLNAVAQELRTVAIETGDVGLQADAAMVDLWVRLFTSPDAWAADAEREATRAIATFRGLGDDRGLARAWSLLGLVQMMNVDLARAEEAWSKAVEHALRAGNRREALEGLSWVPGAVWAGPTPAEHGIARCREVFEQAQGDRKAMASALFSRAFLEAGLGRFTDARELFGRARALLEEVALPVWMAGPLTQAVGLVELLDGKPAAAERELRAGYETLRAIGEVTLMSTVAGILADAICAQGRYEEAERYTRVSEESAAVEDVYTQVLWRSVRAKVLAHQGDLEQALRLAREALDRNVSTDSAHLRWHTLMSAAEVLRLAGRPGEAATALDEAVRVAEHKGNLVGARRAREALEDLPA